MAIKTFTTGEVLTASDTNTYLANSGLVFVKSQTIGNGVGSVTVPDAFSAIYDNYKIVVGGGVGSTASTSVRLALGASTTGYYGTLAYYQYAVNATNYAHDNNASPGQFSFIGNAGTSQFATSFDLLNPFLAKWTVIKDAAWVANNAVGNYAGVHQVATSYSAFTFTPEAGTLTGGTIIVYGYRKA
jgi:hypothetical protein